MVKPVVICGLYTKTPLPRTPSPENTCVFHWGEGWGEGFLWKAGTLSVLALLATCGLSRAELEGETKVKETLQALVPYVAVQPGKNLSSYFHQDFVKQIIPAQLEQQFKNIHTAGGKATGARVLMMTGPYAAEAEFILDKGFRIPLRIRLDRDAPHKIMLLDFGNLVKEIEKSEDVQADLRKLPGTIAYSLVHLGGAAPKVVLNHNGDKPLPVGSTFKLCVFATLVDEIGQGKRLWQDVVPVRHDLASLPAGLVQDWPDGAPVTLYTLAALMISKSDNTAADHLIHVLGRDRIEAMQRTLGIQSPERNQPFMTTAEALKIKLVCRPDVQKQFADASADERRVLLETVIKKTPLSRPRPPRTPVLVDKVDWFFSTSELCLMMEWLHRQRQIPFVEDILSIEEGLTMDKRYWSYVGYKGGAEPGVLNFTMLLQNQKKEWYAFAITWMNPQTDVDLSQFIQNAKRLLRSMQKQ